MSPLLWKDEKPQRWVQLLNTQGALIAEAPVPHDNAPSVIMIDFDNGDPPIVLAKIDTGVYREVDLALHFKASDIERLARGHKPEGMRSIEIANADRGKNGGTKH